MSWSSFATEHFFVLAFAGICLYCLLAVFVSRKLCLPPSSHEARCNACRGTEKLSIMERDLFELVGLKKKDQVSGEAKPNIWGRLGNDIFDLDKNHPIPDAIESRDDILFSWHTNLYLPGFLRVFLAVISVFAFVPSMLSFYHVIIRTHFRFDIFIELPALWFLFSFLAGNRYYVLSDKGLFTSTNSPGFSMYFPCWNSFVPVFEYTDVESYSMSGRFIMRTRVHLKSGKILSLSFTSRNDAAHAEKIFKQLGLMREC